MTYCSILTDNQLANVLCDEARRTKRGGKVGATAKELYHEAREECAGRRMNADFILAERDVEKP